MAQAVKELWPEVKVTIGPAIEDGFYYDFDKKESFTDEDLLAIEKKMKEIIKRNPSFTMSRMKSCDAIEMFRKMGETYKIELIEDLKEDEVSICRTGNEWLDLCKGPHIESAGKITAFKLLSVAGAYWRGDEKKTQLQRIYGTAFFDKKELDGFLKVLEEAKKRDHRKLGPQLDLFNFYQDTAGPGLVFYHPAGAILRRMIEEYVVEQNVKRGYQLVQTPHILKGKLWEISGHSGHYRENMFYFKVDDEEYAVKPMNCPGHILIYKSKTRSYRDMPVRFFELGNVYRKEKAGVMHGLLRVRGFTQDDAHIFCREDQVKQEVMSVIDFTFDVMKDFGFNNVNIELSTRPENYIGTLENWETATKALEAALKEKGLAYQINEGDGAFYGPKIDVKLKDALNREWQCATIQCDFALPQRFEMEYINDEGKTTQPIMIHRAILGSVERFIGTLIEHYAGAFPVWLAPVQAAIIPIAPEHGGYAAAVKEQLQELGLRVTIDDRNESLNKRIREGTVKKIPYLLVIGDKEVKDSTVAIRKYAEGDQGACSVGSFADRACEEVRTKKH